MNPPTSVTSGNAGDEWLVDGSSTEELQELRVVSWVRRMALWVCRLVLVLVSFSVVAVLAYRWTAHGVKVVLRRVEDGASELYALLDSLSPSPDSETRTGKIEQMDKVLHDVLGGAIEASTFFEGIPASYWITLLLGVVVVISGLTLLYGTVKKMAVRRIQVFRGVQFESVREGSAFRKAEIPNFQVAIKELGTWTDKHLGYGIRFNEYLVTPCHVVTDSAGELVKQLYLVGPKGKASVSVNITRSLAVDDLCYVYLESPTWSLLGASKAKWATKAATQHVTCTGASGQSSGRLQKTHVEWMMAYSGSTIPGMSGAAYCFQGMVEGLHQGASGSYNVGFSAVLVGRELSLLCRSEDTGDTNKDVRVPRFQTGVGAAFWKEMEAMDNLSKKYADSKWAEDYAMDYDQKLVMSDDEESARKRQKPISVQLPNEGVRVSLQSDGAPTVSYSVMMTSDEREYLLSLRAARVLERLEEVEGVLKRRDVRKEPASIQCPHCEVKCRSDEKFEQHMKNSHTPAASTSRKCELCGVECRSVVTLERHMINSHPQPVVGESAVPADTGLSGKTVKQSSFLGRRSNSRKNKRKSSPASSSSSTSSVGSPRLEESLSLLAVSQTNIEKCLKELLEATRGRPLEEKQN